MTDQGLPILYTFRRCPYAIRARLAIKASAVPVRMVEVSLRNKPQAMLDCSPKGTVPVLHFQDGTVIDQSIDIMRWALAINDPQDWLIGCDDLSPDVAALIAQNDGSFKHSLDRYKYAERFPTFSAADYRLQCELFLSILNARLSLHGYLLRDQPSLADMALFPFIRQFAHVDKEWFYGVNNAHIHVIRWLDSLIESPLFGAVMEKKCAPT
ncbi:glutathione S-transferase [Glaciimonas sp. CA11.2]|uniref:glutathione S-transferase n=1 Tax=Glaciimonas sp. CA11.2 TaxID=3048601 RepID=UPI002AB3436B|nr:glutathione S-transferase [Glaciimonas sp. CA11.2]MDY7546978.1 glutathione S-transferase [Glaciimonas sp. CA11.2]MEB0163587.1 glutathione S-transferase [Glaciimonas sp. CA11.2]